jgi:endonuclease/exonuclease/phosphatase family metal-dependent hydrolase
LNFFTKGTTILSRFPLSNTFIHLLPSNQQRKLLLSDAHLSATETLSLANIQLEGGRWERDTQRAQLDSISRLLFPLKNDVLMAGDFHFDGAVDADLQSMIEPSFVDLWRQQQSVDINNSNNGSSAASDTSGATFSQDSIAKRFDRIYLQQAVDDDASHSSSRQWSVTSASTLNKLGSKDPASFHLPVKIQLRRT